MQPRPRALSEKARELAAAAGDYIKSNDTFVTSQPGVSTIRFECLPDSSLPQLFESRGYQVSNCGSGQRLLPIINEAVKRPGTSIAVTVQHVGPVEVAIFEFKLPFG